MANAEACQTRLPVVCMAVGEMGGLADLYVSRLQAMLARHCPAPFRLYCYTDRPRALDHSIEQRRCDGWNELRRDGMRPTTLKLGLFNPDYVEFDRFLYLDLTLVIRAGMSHLLAEAAETSHSLIAVRDWHHEGLNSSVMGIRRGALTAIYESFARGEHYPQRVPGDQDFINAAAAAHGLAAQLGTFSSGTVESFKRLMRLARRRPLEARRALQASTVVKFHGAPRVHDLFDPWRYGFRVRLKELAHGRWSPALPVNDLREAWMVGAEPGVSRLCRPSSALALRRPFLRTGPPAGTGTAGACDQPPSWPAHPH